MALAVSPSFVVADDAADDDDDDDEVADTVVETAVDDCDNERILSFLASQNSPKQFSTRYRVFICSSLTVSP